MLLIFAAVFALFASADGTAEVITNVSRAAFEASSGQALFTFDQTNEGWDTDDKSLEVTLSKKISAFPYSSLTGDGCLIVRSESAAAGQAATVSRIYNTPIDLSDISTLSLGVNCTSVRGVDSYSLSIELLSENDRFYSVCNISAECWSGVYFDVSGWNSRESVKEIRLSLVFNGDNTRPSHFEFYIDSVSISESGEVCCAARFSAMEYTVSRGDIAENGGVLEAESEESDLRLDSKGFLYKNDGTVNALMVRFEAESGCTGVRLEIYGKNGRKANDTLVKPASQNGQNTVILPFERGEINEVSIIFEGTKSGQVRIYAIEPRSAYTEQNNGESSVDTCVINPNTNELIIRGSLGHDVFSENKNREIYLFAHDMGDTVVPSRLTDADCIEKSAVLSENFMFRIDYRNDKDERQFLYKKYTVAVKTDKGYTVIGGPRYVSNPESLSLGNVEKMNNGTGKGIYGTGIAFMQENGVSDTVMWVDVGKFFAVESTGGSKFECGEDQYFYNNEYFSSIDNMIGNYREKNISVTLVFVVSDTGSETLNKLLIHKNADLSALYCAYNTSDSAGLAYLRAISEFFAQRYCVDGTVTRVAFGDGVALARTNYNMGKTLLGQFVDEYAKGLRTVYNAMKAIAPATEVYTYIDDNWDNGTAFDAYSRFDNKSFLQELNRCIRDGGNIAWGVAQNPYPLNTENYFSYSDNSVTGSDLSPRVTFKNVEVLLRFLKESLLLYGNSPRDFIVIEKTNFSDVSEQNVTADYVYNSYKALVNGVSAYLTNRSCNYNKALKYIDTNLSLTASSFVPDLLGVSTWESIIEGFSPDKVAKRKVFESKISLTKPETKGEMVLYDFSNGTEGWQAYGFTESLSPSYTVSDRSGLLSLLLGNVPAGESRGIVKRFDTPFNMADVPILHMTVNVASLPTNVNYATVRVILTSGNETYSMDCTVRETVWTDLYCDFSGASGIGRVDSIEILFEASENYYDSPQILISSIRGMSKDRTDGELVEIFSEDKGELGMTEDIKRYVVIALSGVCALAVIAFTVRRTARVKPTKRKTK